MHPELFEIPFVHLTVKAYGLLLVIGFLACVYLIKRLCRSISLDTSFITNAALYALIAGVAGARLFFVVHHFDQFHGRLLLEVFAVWQGGLELLGGVLLAIIVIIFYLWRHRLPVRRCLDILAVGLTLVLAFGRLGCFFNGCCFGKPADLPWAVRFPYGSLVYISQVNPDPGRNRSKPYIRLPAESFGYVDKSGIWYPKPYEELNVQQKEMVTNGPYRCLPVHPTQLYSSAEGAILCLIFYFLWRRSRKAENSKTGGYFLKPGCIFSLMFILYGISRFFMEFLRDDNPFEFDGLTISQNIGIVMVIIGVILTIVFEKMKPDKFISKPS